MIRQMNETKELNEHTIRQASENDHIETIKLLIEAGAHINADYEHAIRQASENDHIETIKLLIEDDVIRQASENGDTETVLCIIQHHRFPFQKLSEQHKKLVRELLSIELLEHFIPDLASLISKF
jgi:ankyrin repeat protein